MKKIISLSIAICIIFTSAILTTSAATNAQGYAIYRDGAGINPDWHSGYIYSSSFNASNTVIHVDNGENGDDADTNHLINYVTLSEFIDNEEFYGYYIPHKFASSSIEEANEIKNNVIDTAKKLQERTKDDLVYNLTNQVWYKKDSNNNGKVDIEEITSMRCDGLIEYCYEKNNALIYGGNISTYDTSIRNAHTAVNITPKKQATLYMQNCLGDINYDYKVTAADARLALQYSSQTITGFDSYQLFVTDVDGSGVITAADARLILQYSSALIDMFPADPLSS